MKYLVLIAAIVAVVCAQSGDHEVNPTECGKRPFVDKFITGGKPANVSAHPWIVSFESSGSHICGGSLLNRRWVVTAGHCVSTTPSALKNYRVKIGSHDRSNPTKWQVASDVDKVIRHVSYNTKTLQNDIALLRLTSRVEYNDNIVPACLNKDSSKLKDSDVGVAAGWGTTSSGGFTLPAVLRDVELPYSNSKKCTDKYGIEYDEKTMVCFGENDDDMDTCQGDSGGPLVIKVSDKLYELVGLTSWGYGCGDIGVYTRVSNYIQWVQDNIAANQN